MKYDPDKHHRRSIRLKKYDYSQSGAYFVTVVTQDRACLFGEIANGAMWSNDAGRMVQAVWEELSIHYPGVEGDEFVVMPNHLHGIVVLVGAGPCACPDAGSRVATGPRACPDEEGGHPQGGRPYVVVAGRHAPVQNPDHEKIRRQRQTIGLDTVSRPIVAAKLLRTHRPRRRILESDQTLHSRQSGPVEIRP